MHKGVVQGIVGAALASLVWLGSVPYCAAKEPTVDELFNRGTEAADKHETDKAIALLERVIELSPRALNAYVNLSVCYARDKRNFPRAESIVKRALAMSPENFRCQYQYALVLTDQKKLVQARNILLKANPKTSAERAKRDSLLKLIDDSIKGKKK